MKSVWGWAFVASAVAVVAPMGCSSSSSNNNGGGGGGVCTGANPAPCGGNIAGTWQVTGACYSGAVSAGATTQICPGATAQIASFSENGTLTFNADLTYTMSLSSQVTEAIDIPASCLMQGGVTLTCDQLGAAFNAAKTDGGVTPGTCLAAAGGCACSFSLATQASMGAGMYTVNGSTVTLSPSTGMGGGAGNFCVQGNTLYLTLQPNGGSVGGISGVSLTATR